MNTLHLKKEKILKTSYSVRNEEGFCKNNKNKKNNKTKNKKRKKNKKRLIITTCIARNEHRFCTISPAKSISSVRIVT